MNEISGTAAQRAELSQIGQATQILMDWYVWCKRYRVVSGEPGVAPYCKSVMSSKSFDELEEGCGCPPHAEAIDALIDRLRLPLRAAIGFEMRNRVGPKVWRRQENAPVATYAEALFELMPMMRKAGMIG